MTDRITQCDVVDCCEDCPRYADDCDGDKYLDRYPTMHEYAEGKRINPKLTDLISRADAIEEISKGVWNVHELVGRIKALPSADAVQRGGRSMRLIDADALIPMMKYATTDNEIGVFPIRIGFDAIKKVIDDAPTIDAVDVVRCKDCKHYSVKGETTQFGFCGYRHTGTDETDYCSRAVRRKE